MLMLKCVNKICINQDTTVDGKVPDGNTDENSNKELGVLVKECGKWSAQRLVLALIKFLIFVNDMPSELSSYVNISTDDVK